MERSALGNAPRLLALGLVACALVALVWEPLDPRMPLGVVNEGAGVLLVVRLAIGATLVATFDLLAFGWHRPTLFAVSRVCCALILTVVGVQLSLYLLDRLWVSSIPDSPYGGPYYEERTRDGRPVIMKKGDPSRLGFRTANVLDHPTPARRLLFLGDSYVEGSGSELKCNFPQVAGDALSVLVGAPVDVLSAGVAGYGPVEAANLLDFLIEKGIRIDVVVYALFVENDFTDDLPGTIRRVSAGMPFRVPQSVFQQLFDPLHSPLSHWVLFLGKTRFAGDAGWQQTKRDERACGSDAVSIEQREHLPPELIALARRRFETNYGASQRTADTVVLAAIEKMRAAAASIAAPFVTVTFPDRIAVDPALRSAVVQENDFDDGRLTRALHQGWSGALYDVSPALAEGAAMYRWNDTHLSDAGNLAAGRAVGTALARDRDVRRALTGTSP